MRHWRWSGHATIVKMNRYGLRELVLDLISIIIDGKHSRFVRLDTLFMSPILLLTRNCSSLLRFINSRADEESLARWQAFFCIEQTQTLCRLCVCLVDASICDDSQLIEKSQNYSDFIVDRIKEWKIMEEMNDKTSGLSAETHVTKPHGLFHINSNVWFHYCAGARTITWMCRTIYSFNYSFALNRSTVDGGMRKGNAPYDALIPNILSS